MSSDDPEGALCPAMIVRARSATREERGRAVRFSTLGMINRLAERFLVEISQPLVVFRHYWICYHHRSVKRKQHCPSSCPTHCYVRLVRFKRHLATYCSVWAILPITLQTVHSHCRTMSPCLFDETPSLFLTLLFLDAGNS